MVKKIIFILILILSVVMLTNNAFHYPVNGGYDANLHLRYAKIISEESRMPTFAETRENYNPPLFYLLSGWITRGYGYLTAQPFFDAAKIWQYVNVILLLVSLYWWCRLVKTNWIILVLLSWPVIYKTVVMFSIETWFLFTVSLAFWFFSFHFSRRPTLVNAVILGLFLVVNLLSRLSAVTVLLTILAGMVGLVYIRAISLRKMLSLFCVFILVVISGCSWFYLGRKDEGIYGVGEGGEVSTPFFQRQPISFYLDVPFRLMMTYPLRQSTPVNKLVPIYYSEFWGDFWNYYPQRRFGQTVTQLKTNREESPSSRIKILALQNQINLVPTLLIIYGFCRVLVQFWRRLGQPDRHWLFQGMLLTFTLVSWLGFLALLTKYPSWKGDSIKASYMLFLMPVLAYFLIDLMADWYKRKKYLFWPASLWLVLSGIINWHFAWF